MGDGKGKIGYLNITGKARGKCQLLYQKAMDALARNRHGLSAISFGWKNDVTIPSVLQTLGLQKCTVLMQAS